MSLSRTLPHPRQTTPISVVAAALRRRRPGLAGGNFETSVPINRPTLDELLERGLATSKRELPGVLADGTEVQVPVYQVAQFSIGPCLLQDVEAAVFPTTQRQILGLNVLN